MSLLLNTCSAMTNRVLNDDGARWILQGDEQERENRTAGVKALYSMLAATTSGRAKELVKQGLSDRNGMIAFGRIRERFGKTARVAKLSDVFQFQWTSSDSLEDKWLRWQKLMRQVNMTSLGDDARETLTIGLEKAKERSLEQHLRLRAPSTWTVLCASVDQYFRMTVDSSSQPAPMEIGAVMSTCACCGEVAAMPSAAIVERLAMCRQREKSAVARVLAKAARVVETQTSAIVVDRSVIEDLIALVETSCSLCGKRGHLSHVCRSSGGNASARAVEAEPVQCEEEREIQHVWALSVCVISGLALDVFVCLRQLRSPV